MEPKFDSTNIKAIIGLGNPGQKYYRNRHNIGFRVVDALVDQFHGSWQTSELMEYATVRMNDASGQSHDVVVIKPRTFMNNSGKVLGWLQKKGIKPDQIVVVHDELEKGFGKVLLRFGGSHKGHNGLKSIMGSIGPDFWRLKFGISRPDDREEVPDYVLADFSKQEEEQVPDFIDQSISLIV